jgi:hypothetical protein
VSHLGAELEEAWRGLRRAGWSGTWAWVSGGVWRRGQSAREDEGVRNEARGECGALAGLQKGSWARGRASWPGNPATCASAHAPVHDEREEGGTDKTGPRRRERKEDRGGNGSALANRARKTERESR